MTDAQPTPVPVQDFAAWEMTDREQIRLANELLPANKTALFDALAAAGIEIVSVTFDGYGDSGQIENIEAKTGDEIVDLPLTQIEIARPVWGSSEIEWQNQAVREAIEAMAYALLGQTHGGWENSDGGYGAFVFDVAERSITLDYNERHMESDFSEHVF